MATIGPIKMNGGWVSDSDFWNPPPNGGVLTLRNMQPFAYGCRTMDNLSTGSALTQLTTHSQVHGFFYWQDPAQEGLLNNSDIVIAIVGGKVYTAPLNNVVWTDRTGATAPPQQYYTFDVLNGIVMMAQAGSSPTQAPMKLTAYNGNAALLGGSPPMTNIVKVVNNFAFLAQNLSASGVMSRVYWSNIADPETWGAASFVDVRKNDGDVVTALSSIGTDLIIFKTNSIHRLSTTTTAISGVITLGPLVQVSDRIGCVGPLSADILPDGSIVFLSTDLHLYRFDGVQFYDLSGNPFPKSNLNNVFFPQDASAPPFCAPLYYSCVKADPEFHRIFVILTANSGTVAPIYVYDYKLETWSDWTDINAGTAYLLYMNTMPSAYSVSGLGAKDKRVYFGSSTGYIAKTVPWGSGPQCFDQAVQITCTVETTIPLGSSSPPNFIPRSIAIPIRIPQGGSAGTIKTFIGFDGTYPGSATNTTATTAIVGNRIVFNIGEKATTLTRHPLTMQVKIQIVANVAADAVIVEPFYVSDEILG